MSAAPTLLPRSETELLEKLGFSREEGGGGDEDSSFRRRQRSILDSPLSPFQSSGAVGLRDERLNPRRRPERKMESRGLLRGRGGDDRGPQGEEEIKIHKSLLNSGRHRRVRRDAEEDFPTGDDEFSVDPNCTVMVRNVSLVPLGLRNSKVYKVVSDKNKV